MTPVPAVRLLPHPLAPEAEHEAGPSRRAMDRLLDTVLRFTSADRRPLPGSTGGDSLTDHLARYGARPRSTGAAGRELLAALEEAALTGHGGAHFPVARKWHAMLQAGGGGTIVANGAEGEPASAKDAALLHARPHLVLDGVAVAAEALGATRAVVWLHAGDAHSRRTVCRALAERQGASLDPVPVTVRSGPDRYLTGESSAVVRALDGGPALPAFRRSAAATSGIGGRGTLVANVETLARVALIARGGAGCRPGPLVTVAGADVLTVAELRPDLLLGHAFTLGVDRLYLAAGHRGPQAVLAGGYGGQWVPWPEAAGLPLGDLDGVHGPSLGAGVLAAIPNGACGLVETAAILDYLARSSAQQCGPCRHGTRELADAFQRIAVGRPARRDRLAVEQLSALIRGRGACRLPDSAAQLATSALTAFAADLEAHLRERPCRGAGAAAMLPIPGRRPSRPPTLGTRPWLPPAPSRAVDPEPTAGPPSDRAGWPVSPAGRHRGE
ncbi:MAG TPA: NADH-ubiquinone oxidoreductase-F iron-sulfur binding region domain-containing protein [Kineosporiaceae bacterium]